MNTLVKVGKTSCGFDYKDFEPGQRWPEHGSDDQPIEDVEGSAVDLDELSDLTASTTSTVDPMKDEPKLEDPRDLKLYR